MEKVFEKWKWIQLNKNEITSSTKPDGHSHVWLERVRKNKSNCLRVEVLENGKKALHASLIYRQSFVKEQDYNIFHFYLTTDKWITVDLDVSPFDLKRMDQMENAVNGFLLFLGELMNEMLAEIDQFEESLKTLIWSVRKRNETRILELVYRQRHELLVWKNLLIPIKELKMAIEEVKLHEGGDSEIFHCTGKRIERAFVLLNEYEHELDSMINLEEVISSHRGNEIMKTLTVITTIFTPIMAFGALWGMNFKYMPELGWKYGYPFSIIITVVFTLLLYGYLKIKGWTGDLLKGKRKGSFFK